MAADNQGTMMATETDARSEGSFDEKTYLDIHPDVAAAVDAGRFESGWSHYDLCGRAEGRVVKRSEPRTGIVLEGSDRFETRAPSRQNIIDIFQGEWSSKAPDGAGFVTEPGPADLFEDARIAWAADQLGSFRGKRILELGPLEGAHSYMMSRAGASEIIAIENNSRAFLKCLCIKETFSLTNVSFKFGDFCKYLQNTPEQFDRVIACGVLYHMIDPIDLLRSIAKITNEILLWTHYLDWDVIKKREDASLFKEIQRPPGFSGLFEAKARVYPEVAINWSGFCGGQHDYAVWLSKNTITALLTEAGFSKLSTAFDHTDHPNGPAFAVCAQR